MEGSNFHHAKAMTATSITQPNRRHQYRQCLDRNSGGILSEGKLATQSLELEGLALKRNQGEISEDYFFSVCDYHVLLISASSATMGSVLPF